MLIKVIGLSCKYNHVTCIHHSYSLSRDSRNIDTVTINMCSRIAAKLTSSSLA